MMEDVTTFRLTAKERIELGKQAYAHGYTSDSPSKDAEGIGNRNAYIRAIAAGELVTVRREEWEQVVHTLTWLKRTFPADNEIHQFAVIASERIKAKGRTGVAPMDAAPQATIRKAWHGCYYAKLQDGQKWKDSAGETVYCLTEQALRVMLQHAGFTPHEGVQED